MKRPDQPFIGRKRRALHKRATAAITTKTFRAKLLSKVVKKRLENNMVICNAKVLDNKVKC